MSNHKRKEEDSWLHYFGAISAVAGSVAIAAKIVENTSLAFPGYASHFEANEDPTSPPPFLKRQLFAGLAGGGNASTGSSWSTSNAAGSNKYTVKDLEGLAKRYKEECKLAAEEGNYARVQWLCETQHQLSMIIEIRREFEATQKVGDFDCLPPMISKVQKLQQVLSQRLQQETTKLPVNSIVTTTTDHAAMFSPHEVLHRIITIDEKMKEGLDLESPGGFAHWRKLNHQKECLVKMQCTFEKLNEAAAENMDSEAYRDLSDQLQNDHNAFLLSTTQDEEKQHLKTTSGGGNTKSGSLFQKLGETFGFAGTATKGSSHEGKLPRSTRQAKKSKRKQEDIIAHTGPSMTLRSRSERTAKKPSSMNAVNSPTTGSKERDSSTSVASVKKDMEDCEKISTYSTPSMGLTGAPPVISYVDDFEEMSPPTLCGTEIQYYDGKKDDEDLGSINTANLQQLKPPSVQDESSSPQQRELTVTNLFHSSEGETPINLPDVSNLKPGSFIHNFEGRSFYITDDNETLKQAIRKKIQGEFDFLEDNTAKEIREAMIDFNEILYERNSLESEEELVPGLLLLVPHPSKWHREPSVGH